MNVVDQRWKRKLPWNVNWWVSFNFFGYNLISIVKIGDVTHRYVICPCNFFHIKQSRLMLTFPFVPLICHFLVHWQTGSGNMAASLSLNPMKERKTINALKQIKLAKCIFLPLRIKQTPTNMRAERASQETIDTHHTCGSRYRSDVSNDHEENS